MKSVNVLKTENQLFKKCQILMCHPDTSKKKVFYGVQVCTAEVTMLRGANLVMRYFGRWTKQETNNVAWFI